MIHANDARRWDHVVKERDRLQRELEEEREAKNSIDGSLGDCGRALARTQRELEEAKRDRDAIESEDVRLGQKCDQLERELEEARETHRKQARALLAAAEGLEQQNKRLREGLERIRIYFIGGWPTEKDCAKILKLTTALLIDPSQRPQERSNE